MLHIDDDLIKILNNENLREKEESYLNKQGLPTLDISIDGLDESIKKVERECETGKEILMEIDIVLSCLYSKLGTITCSNNNYSNDQINIINDIVTKYESKREKIYEIFITKFNLKNDLENVKLELLKKYNNININNDINNYTDNNSIIPKIPIIPSTFSSYSAFSSDCNSKHCEDNNNNNYEYDNNGELYYPQDEIIGNNSLSNISYYNDYYHYNSSSDSKIYSDDDIGNIDDLKGIKELEEQEQIAN
ncbi:hypothetical protein FG379_002422 [Cryptosporidium bovis]|uniref:uncharacterized protein n=1 Tax=Cryptosporidium bovis TaxID=310047 RepID=UPI00351A920C|nr:hypothetical protein FG379_002422 [Cryptosporidium bovis]